MAFCTIFIFSFRLCVFCLTLIPNPRSHDWNTGFIVTLAAPLRRPFSGSSTFHCKCAGKYVSLDVSVLIACDAEGQEGIFKRKSFPHFPQRYTLCVVSVTELIFFLFFIFLNEAIGVKFAAVFTHPLRRKAFLSWLNVSFSVEMLVDQMWRGGEKLS